VIFVSFFTGYKGLFKWFEYLKQTKSSAAPVKLFDKVKQIYVYYSSVR